MSKRTRPNRSRAALRSALPIALWTLAGCGTPPPCNVKPAQLEAAREEAATAAAAADTVGARAAAEVAALKAEIAALEAQAAGAGEREALVQRLAELKKGSGR